MKSIHAVFSKRSDDWYTPKEIYDELQLRHGKQQWFDPCPLGALEYGYDGLKEKWGGNLFILTHPIQISLIL